MNLLQKLIDVNELCNDSLVTILVSVVKTVFVILLFIIPAILIILCAIDLFKAMTGGDDKEIAKSKKNCIRRLIYALIIFLIPFLLGAIIRFVNSIVDIDGTDEAVSTFDAFFACWDKDSAGSNNNSNGYACYGYDNNNNRYKVEFNNSESCTDNGYSWEK